MCSVKNPEYYTYHYKVLLGTQAVQAQVCTQLLNCNHTLLKDVSRTIGLSIFK